MIKAPFNFVPLADKVFFPDWANIISQDMPFSDGLDGYLDIEFTAQTPVFVRNGHSKEDGLNRTGDYNSAAITPDGRYYLPAASVKGEIRNILEILSFGKMRVDKNAMFAQREWDNPDLYTIKSPQVQSSLCCGWLVRRGEDYCIRKCNGIPYRINHKRLDECFNTDIFRTHFSKDKGISLNEEQEIGGKKYDPKTAAYKYKLLETIGVDRKVLQQFSFSIDQDFAVEYKANRVCVDMSGDISGTIVLTGQPDNANWREKEGFNRRMNDGKFYEFVFPHEIDVEIALSNEEFDHFKFIYQDSDDWNYCKSLLEEDGIPVFFRMRGKSIRDFGLAFLYKLPYENSPYDLEIGGHRYSGHAQEDFDLADCIFGSANKGNALKGRVQFSNFISDNAVQDRNYTLVLNSPKASYYPIYIQQDGHAGVTTKYKTYNDGRLAGWKRYHVRNTIWEKCTGDKKLDTTIYPLKAESTFTGRVCFHNLRPVELGALISAITFHGDTEHCYHQIGQAKPYGFGKMSVKIVDAYVDAECPGFKRDSYNYFLGIFEKQMNKVQGSWNSCDVITQLFTIARQEVTMNDVYDYMILNMEGQNDFNEAKRARLFLQAYSELNGKRYNAPSFANLVDADERIVTELRGNVRDVIDKKEKVIKMSKYYYEDAKKMFFDEVLPIVERLLSDNNYIANQESVDPVVNGERAVDIATLKKIIETGPDNGPGADSLSEHIGKATSPEMVFNRIKNWNKALTSEDIEIIAQKMCEAFDAKKLKPKDRQSWIDDAKFESKWAKLIAVDKNIAVQVVIRLKDLL